MADRLAVLDAGRIVQVGTPEEVYRRPKNAFVANFLGETNLRRGTLEAREADATAVVATAIGRLASASVPAETAVGAPVLLSLRPEAFRVLADGESREGVNRLEVELTRHAYLGELADQIGRTADGEALNFYEINPHGRRAPGSRVGLAIDADDVVCLQD